MSTNIETINEIEKILSDFKTKIENDHIITNTFDFSLLEYFSKSVFNVLFGCVFKNLNETRINAPFIDLINETKKIGIQVTIEKPSSKKMKQSAKSFTRYGISKLIVFFFASGKTPRLNNYYKGEAWGHSTIVEYVKNHIELSGSLLSTLVLWKENSFINYKKLVENINRITKKDIDEMICLKKYNPKLCYKDKSDYDIIRFFCGQNYANSFYLSYKNYVINSPLYTFLEKIDYDRRLLNKYRNDDSVFVNFSNQEIRDYESSLLEEYYESNDNKSKKDYYQYSTRYIDRHLHTLSTIYLASNSEILTIVRSAALGKTFICCELSEDFINDGIPCIFLSHLLNGENIYETFKNRIEHSAALGTYNEKLNLFAHFIATYETPFVILLDGLNEYNDAVGAIIQIENIIRDLKAANIKPKIIISSRNVVFDKFKNRLRAMVNNHLLCLDQPVKTDDKFVKMFFEVFNIRCKDNYQLRRLFNQNRLYVSIFCELFKNSDIDALSVNDFNNLYEAYFNKRAEIDVDDGLFYDKESFNETITSVAKWMIDNNIYESVPLSSFKEEERRKLRLLSNSDIFSINNFDGKDCIQYTFEEYRDYCLCILLENKNSDYLQDLFDRYNGNFEGLARLLFLARRKKNMFKKEKEYSYDWYLIGAIDSLQFLDYKDIDKVDETNMLLFLERDNDNNVIDITRYFYNILIMYLTPKEKDNHAFALSTLFSLSQKQDNNIKTSLDYYGRSVFNSIYDGLLYVDYDNNYLLQLVRFFNKYFLLLSEDELSFFKKIIKKRFNLTNINRGNLLRIGLSKDEVIYLGE